MIASFEQAVETAVALQSGAVDAETKVDSRSSITRELNGEMHHWFPHSDFLFPDFDSLHAVHSDAINIFHALSHIRSSDINRNLMC